MNEVSDLVLEESEGVESTPTRAPLKKRRKLAKNALSYSGKTGQLYKLFLLDFFMRIITLGIYSFWGKTRLRKYLVGSHTLGGDRFEYTGTGGELFKGFLKVLPIIVILFAPIAFADQYPWLTLFYLPIIYCYGIAVYGATRYRYSRTLWRGIRGFIGGSTLKYANLCIKRMIINILTLGFAIPYSSIAKHRYIMNNTYFGNIKAEYYGNGKTLFGAYMKSILLGILLITPAASLFAAPLLLEAMAEGSIFYDSPSNVNTTISSLPGLLSALSYLFAIPLAILSISIARSFYSAALMREKMRGLKVGEMRFMSTVTAGALVKHKLANMLILIFTLGFGYPLIIKRNMNFFARHHIIMGNLKNFEAQQAESQGLTSGEGLDSALDLDTGFI